MLVPQRVSFCYLVSHAIPAKKFGESLTPEDVVRAEGAKLECWIYGYCFAENGPGGAHGEGKGKKGYRIGIASRAEGRKQRTFRPFLDHIGEIQLLAEDAMRLSGSELFYGRLLRPTRADPGLLREWLKCCERDHGARCRSPLSHGTNDENAGLKGLLVIDVRRECICHLPEGARYVALSYCWPAGGALTLGKANHDELLQPGSIGRTLKKFPTTIQDAIDFVSDFGETYLWIDALCTVQDDDDHKQIQLSQMGKVYGAALVTIVSASTTMNPADACAGLPSYHEKSGSRKQIGATVQGLHLMVPFEPIVSLLHKCRWNNRGWTYQECLLSDRILFFTDDQVYFQCSSGVFCEDSAGEDVSPKVNILPRHNLWNPGSGNSTQNHQTLRLNVSYKSPGDMCEDYGFCVTE